MIYYLKKKDYKLISDHYGFITNKKNIIEDKMARKMCRCIKKVKKTLKERPTQITRENAAIAICNKSIFTNRGLKFNKVTCKNKAKFIKNKTQGWKLIKTMKNIKF